MNYTLSTKMVYMIESVKGIVRDEHYIILTQIAKGIMELFNKNATYQLSAESEYMLERYIDEDIPNALQNYREFPRGERQTEIDAALLNQLQIIKNKVDSHESEIQQKILSDMKAQNSYLKMDSLSNLSALEAADLLKSNENEDFFGTTTELVDTDFTKLEDTKTGGLLD